MGTQNTASPLPSDPAGLENVIAELRDDLELQRTIYLSLAELPQDDDTTEQLNVCRAEFKRIQKQLSEARRAHDHAQKNTKSATPKTHQQQNHVNMRETPTGATSSSSSPADMSASGAGPGDLGATLSRPATPSRKRSYSHANVTPAKSSRPENKNKSRRGNENGQDGLSSSPSTAETDDMSVIDLTRDDEVYRKRMAEQEARYERNKQTADRDAALARQFLQNDFGPMASSGTAWSSRNGQSTPTYFDRMIPPHSQTQTPTPRPGQSSAGAAIGRASFMRDMPQRPAPNNATPPQPLGHRPSLGSTAPDRWHAPLMPGTFVDSDEEDAGRPFNPSETGVPGSSRAPYLGSQVTTLAGAYAAAEAARQAAIARDRDRRRGGPSVQPSWDDVYVPPRFIGELDRPGYLTMGSSNPLQVPSSRAASGYSVYKSENPETGDRLGNIIDRTNGYDYDNMTDGRGNPLDNRLSDYIHDVMADPRKTSEEIQNLLSNIRPDMEIPQEERGETPEALKYSLYPHQQLALKWMWDMESGTNKGGILADDMGLGKTISTLSLMVTRKSTTSIKTNLIVGPVALVKQWETEIFKKLKPEHRLSVCLFHQKKMQYSDMKAYDVVLTTYGKLATEFKRYNKHLEARKLSARYDAHSDLELQRQCPLIHPRSKFYRVILDEAQCIKNKSGQASQGANQLTAEHRWCLTGTPMMNGVDELFPLLRFLKIRPYNDNSKFKQAFGSLTARSYTSLNAKERSMQQLRIVLKATMLRRMKDSTIDGKPILTLPPKTEHIENCVFSPDEQSFYEQLETKSQVIFNKYLRAGTVGKNYSHVLVLLLRLRQACCHPHLNMDVEYAPNVELPAGAMEDFAKSLGEAVVARLKDVEAFDCPICFDPVADPTIFIPCGHDTCAECFTSLTENSIHNNIRSGVDEGATAKCPECRAPVDPKKVITYTVFKKVHMPETTITDPVDGKDVDEEDDDSDDSDSGSDTASEAEEDMDDDADEQGNLRDFIVDDDEESEYVDDSVPDEEADDEFPDTLQLAASLKKSAKALKNSKKAGRAKKSKKAEKDKKGKGKADDVKPHMLTTLRAESSKNQEARRKYMRYLRKNWEPSAKTTKVCELLREIEPSGEKTIIFSQWTALLDLLEIPIKYELGLKYFRYDGGMSRAQRDESITQFVENPNVKVLLVSLRAGNAGLNLTVASHVIICDPFWNPFIEMQAVDRAHRIGQQLPVQVHRVLVKGSMADGGSGSQGANGADPTPTNKLAETVEDRIVKLQDQKRDLINAALDEGESRSLGRLSEQELRYLFGVSSR